MILRDQVLIVGSKCVPSGPLSALTLSEADEEGDQQELLEHVGRGVGSYEIII